jgi:glucose/arabinose dehydrogenase
VYWIERGGTIRRLDESTGKVDLIGTLPVTLVGEARLIGILLDRNFATTRHLYLYFSAAGEVTARPFPTRSSSATRIPISSRSSMIRPLGP